MSCLGLPASSRSFSCASMIGCMARWPVMIASRITSSGSSCAPASTISTASRVPATVRSSSDSSCSWRMVGIDHQLAVEIAHLDRGDRALERDARDGQRGAGADDAQDGRIVFLVGRHDQVHDLDVVAVVLGKQRPDGPIGHARGQGGLFAWAAFAFDEAARDLARGVHALFVFDGEREKVDASRGSGEETAVPSSSGVAIADEDGAVGQASEAAGLERHRDARRFQYLVCGWPQVPNS